MITTYEEYRRSLAGTEHEIDVLAHEEKIRRILELKLQKNVLILGHNYMAPLIYNLSENDARGDSLALARYAAKTECPVILFDGVRFMAETAKILNPEKKVLIASKLAGCSLADPIRADQVRQLKAEFPGVPVVTYINSYADVKAESDFCCTSANAVQVIESAALRADSSQVIFLPDSLMGENLQNELENTGSEIKLLYPGKDNSLEEARCEVHEQFSVGELRLIREQHGIPKGHRRRAVLAHWECSPEVLEEADFHGSTSQMSRYIADNSPERVFLATECEMAANLAGEFPEVEFVRSCQMYCRHMRQLTLDGILSALETEDPVKHEITVEEDVRQAALVPLQRMLELTGN